MSAKVFTIDQAREAKFELIENAKGGQAVHPHTRAVERSLEPLRNSGRRDRSILRFSRQFASPLNASGYLLRSFPNSAVLSGL